ncbi:hypothetical protein [Nonomuraea sp. NEAU-A123]|uniref:hypothetical protein n=1 Tax=Nonomuraea sp. NEAU-A123 TaxID=2839649 RepID=UPI001BE3E6CE|nr:hypothetical protein [Nonomuraea sp. NEAU-A123]
MRLVGLNFFAGNMPEGDRGIVTSAARDVGVVIPLGGAVAQLIAALVARGDGDLDHSGLFKLVEVLSGRTE